MDSRLKYVFEASKLLDTIKNQKQVLKDKTEKELSYSYNGGTFTINTLLLTYIGKEVEVGTEEMILLDDNSTPIKVDDLSDFYINIRSKYFEVLNKYYLEFEELKKQRKVIDIMQIKKENDE